MMPLTSVPRHLGLRVRRSRRFPSSLVLASRSISGGSRSVARGGAEWVHVGRSPGEQPAGPPAWPALPRVPVASVLSWQPGSAWDASPVGFLCVSECWLCHLRWGHTPGKRRRWPRGRLSFALNWVSVDPVLKLKTPVLPNL